MHKIRIQIVKTSPDAELPAYFSPGAAGMDLAAAIPDRLTLLPGERATIACGISIAIPDGFEGQVRPRSGLASRQGVTILNAPGTIDSDYRGEIKAILVNHGQASFEVEPGMRIAQLVISPVVRVEWEPAERVLPESTRAAGGFGHTGL